jgi:adenylate cyclase
MVDSVAKPAQKATRFVRRSGRLLGALAIGATLGITTGFFLHKFPLGRGIRNASYDLLHVWSGDVRPNEAVIVYLDDDSHNKLGQPRNAPWDRALHGQLVERLTAAGARAIVFDIVFSDVNSNNPGADARFATAIKRQGSVVLAAESVPMGEKAEKMNRPFDLLIENAAGIGSVERLPDKDLVNRRHTPRVDRPIPSLAWATAELVGVPVTKQEGAEDRQRWLRYYGRPGVIPSFSYYQALNPSDAPDSAFSNKVVFVGARILTLLAGERKDAFPHPFGAFDADRSFMTGVEIQATEFLNLLRGDWLTRLSLQTELWLILCIGLVFGAGLMFMRPIWATAASILSVGVVAGISYFTFVHQRVWFPWLIVVVQIGVALSWSVLFNSVQLYVQKRLFEYTLGLYLSPKLVAKFSSSPAMLKPGAEKQKLTFLFSDIADFTTVSEKMDGDELATMMNDYFQPAVANCIHKTEGTVVKYIGDAIFAFWNAPELQPDHAARACEAALLFRDQSKLAVRGRLLRTRIGLHTGVANVGNFGSEDRVDYTAIGESVNLASRLEGLNKHLGTDCLISGATKTEIGDRFVTRKLGEFQLKGFAGFVQVHELAAFPDQAEATRPWRDAFAEALNNFEQRELVFAEIGFRRVLELKPEDGPAKFYLGRIAELACQELPEAWATQTIIKEK